MAHVKDNTPTSLILSALNERLTICRLDVQAKIPAWAAERQFFSVTRTSDELSIVCPERQVPSEVKCEKGWRAFKIEGPFEFEEVGILASVAKPLAKAGVSIFVIATYDTDYVLVKEQKLEIAASVLTRHGHTVNR